MVKLTDWVIYDCSKVPNEFRCEVCGTTMVIKSPPRYSTLIVIGDKFVKAHTHGRH